MKPAPFQYHVPSTLDEAVRLLSELENARVLAGGQSLMPMLNMRFAMPDHVIDLNRIPTLAGVHESDGMLVIGAMTRQRDLEFSPIVADHCPLMREALTYVGHRQTRNRGTIGGSLCHLDPAAEIVCVCTALNATIDATGAAGSRSIAFADFPLDYLTPALEPGEIVTTIRLPVWPAQTGQAFVEFARRHGDFAIVSAAALLLCDAEGRIARAALALGGMANAPIRVRALEDALVGEVPSAALFEEAAQVCRDIAVADDPYTPASYRQRLAVTLTGRALRLAHERARAGAASPRVPA